MRPHPRIATRSLYALALLGLAVLTAPVTAAAQPTADPLAAARSELKASLDALDQRMGRGSANGKAWQDYLGWQTLIDFSQGSEDGQLVELQQSLDRLTSGHPGLDLPAFQQVAADAQRLFDLMLVRTLPDAAQFAETQAQQLAELLERDPQLLNPRDSYAAEQRLDFFQGAPGEEGRAEELLNKFNQPNLRVSVSSGFIGRVGTRPVRNIGPVRESILGARITGTGDTQGTLTVRTIPSADSARLMLILKGTVHSTTVGRKGPAVINSLGTTPFTGSKLVEISRENFSASPASFDATTRSTTQSICKAGGGIGTRVVIAVAKKQVAQQKSQADSIAGQRAEVRLASEFDAEVEEQLSQGRARFEQEFIAPLTRRDAEPRELRFSTGENLLGVTMLQAKRGQLAAPDAPPESVGGDVALRLHQSAANNLAAAILGGATLRRDSAEEPARLNVPIPDWAKELARKSAKDSPPVPPDFKPWAITFRRNRPVSFRFTENEIELQIHAARIETDNEPLTGWDLILRFEPLQQDGQIVLVRKGEIDALPTEFDPRSGRRVTSRQVGYRNNLKAQLNKQSGGQDGLPSVIELGPIKLRNDRGELVTKAVSSVAGWLCLVWDAR